jgi:hypothetical protein
MTEISNPQEWQLESLSITFNNWGDYKGKHTGKIVFHNKQSDAFTFFLTPEKTNDYLQLVKDEIVSNASTLGQKLLQSLNLLPAAPDKMAIAEEIQHEEVK